MDDRSTEHAPVVSVIVPCLGHADVLGECLDRLANQDTAEPFEVIVVDSASDPDVAAAARAARVRLVRSDAHLLPGPARNRGVDVSRAELIAFTDADCLPELDWLSAATRSLTANTRLAGGPVLDAYRWHAIAIADNLLQFADFPSGRPPERAAYFPSCNMVCRKSDLLAVGGFPDTGLAAGEDTLLCNAFRERWPDGLRFTPGMRIRHRGRTGLRGFLRHQRMFGRARSLHAINLKPAHRKYGRWWIMLVPVALKRLTYIVRRVAWWQPRRLLVVVALSPLLVLGLLAWAVGFRAGLHEAERGVAGTPATLAVTAGDEVDDE